ncbi:probable folate-biopterin transporter 2 isoform X1 [Salvia miltiorrhiza]|uniref:probable folate-biopterin transporter 2 isoform X1 n=2 Tax=Salvia miltiorrhiza TaxID=226208 RepID=UPI0025AD01FD|nr:probable folate-biopterin transporter 2 isoform X1 [Salvia miltiorrhiza]XP_057799350.1 probable folate-biopterin transporter 2 isoform X1 [Salvia miltiorrhiza]
MGEDERLPTYGDEERELQPPPPVAESEMRSIFCSPVHWFKMLARELHWSFVFGVVIVYGVSQGLGGALARVGTQFYMKDVQKVQPSEAQVYAGITSLPWIVKPLWGILTDVVPISGYQRRPYFVFAGSLGIVSMLFLSLHPGLHIVLALLSLTAASASVAIADVTVDACVAQKSGLHHSLAADMQSLCSLSSSIGALVGFSLSGIFVHLIGPQGVYGLLTIPAGLVFVVGILLKEQRVSSFGYEQISQNLANAGKAMWNTLKCPDVWRPCLYMYLSFSLGLNVSEGMFYWVTDSAAGPSFSKQIIGYIMAIGSVGSLLGAILYQYGLKDYPFRDLLFWAQILSCLSGMLDLALVLRWNLRLGVPDLFFVVADASVSQMIGRLKWMPLLVLSSKMCPPGIEGTFFALLMSIDNAGLLTSSWLGGLLLHVLNVTRTEFDNMWLAILIRNVLRIAPLFLLFLVPRADPNSSLLPDDVVNIKETAESENVELVALVDRTDGGR